MRKTLSFLIVTFIFSTVFAQNEIPLIGEIQTMHTTVCRTDVRRNERSKIDCVYTAPAGWQILSFKPVVIENRGASYRFSQNPSHFAYSSPSVIYSKFIELLELAAEKNELQKYEARINQMRSDFEKYSNKVVPTYAKITTTASVAVTDESATRKAGRLYLDLKVTLVYMPDTEDQLLQSLEAFRQLINMGE